MAPDGGRMFVVTQDRGDRHLPPGTRLREERTFEAWDHQGSIESIRTVVADMRVLDGERAGEVVQVALESGRPGEEPIWRADWLAKVTD